MNRQYDEDGLDYVSGALASGGHPVERIIHMPKTESKNQRPLGKLRGKIVSQWHQKNKHLLVFSSKGGETEFPDLDLTISPECGKLLVFPSIWTYLHRGNVPISNDKYILGSYKHYV